LNRAGRGPELMRLLAAALLLSIGLAATAIAERAVSAE
jgi:hypothetical protein